MIPKIATDKQKAVLHAAARTGNPHADYPAPTVTPVDGDGVLHPTPDTVDKVELIVDYDGMPSNDVLVFLWNGDTSIAPVAADSKPKTVAVPAALVMEAAGKTIDVLYAVVDDANPDGVASAILKLVVDEYVEPEYPAPVITEASGGELDIFALIADAHVNVAAWPDIAAGQKIWLTVTSTPPYGATAWNGEIVADTGEQTTTLDLARLRALDDGSTLTLRVEVSFDGTERVAFPETTYNVKNVVPAFSAPVITEASGTELDISALTADANVTLAAWPYIAVGQKIWLTVTSTPAYGVTPWNGTAIVDTGTQRTTLDLTRLKTLQDGSQLDLLVEVSFDGTTRVPFPVTRYTIRQPAPVYPAPVITEAVDGVLVISDLSGDAHVTVQPWPGIAAGQQMWLTVDALPFYGIKPWDGFAIVDTGAQSTTLELARLQGLRDESPLTLTLEVSLDGTTRVTFPVAHYTVDIGRPVNPAPVITEAVDGVLDVGALRDNAIAYAHVTQQPWPGISIGHYLWLNVLASAPVDEVPPWERTVVQDTGVQSTNLSVTELNRLEDGSTLTLVVEVLMGKDGPRVEFPNTTYTIRNRVAGSKTVAITRVEGGDGEEIPSGGSTAYTRVTLTGTVETN